MTHATAASWPGLTPFLLQQGSNAGNGKSDLLNDQVSNIDCGTVRSILSRHHKHIKALDAHNTRTLQQPGRRSQASRR